MDPLFTIRGFIFLIAGLALFLFPRITLGWQQKFVSFLITKLHLNFMKHFIVQNVEIGAKSFRNLGIFFLVVAVGLFVYAWFN